MLQSCRSVQVRNLPKLVSDATLLTHLRKVGDVVEMNISEHEKEAVAFVKYCDVSAADRCVQTLSNTLLNGCPIDVVKDPLHLKATLLVSNLPATFGMQDYRHLCSPISRSSELILFRSQNKKMKKGLVICESNDLAFQVWCRLHQSCRLLGAYVSFN